MIKALFFDIDGTLVSFRTHSVPASTVRALTAAHEAGVRIFISTGRPAPLINNLDPILHLIDGYITVNGAICTVGGQTISRTPIDPEDVRTILGAADRWGVPSLIVGEDRAIVHNHRPIVDQVFGGMLAIKGIDTRTTTEEMLSRPVYQLTPFFDDCGTPSPPAGASIFPMSSPPRPTRAGAWRPSQRTRASVWRNAWHSGTEATTSLSCAAPAQAWQWAMQE